MLFPSIFLICDHAPLDLPVREVVGQINSSLQPRDLRDRALNLALIQRRAADGSAETLGDGNRNTTRPGLGQWDGRGKEGKNGKDKRV